MKQFKKIKFLIYVATLISQQQTLTTNHEQKFIYMTVLFNEKNETRQEEYITCLQQNLKHPSIKKIHILYDTSQDDTSNKLLSFIQKENITITYIKGKATFDNFFTLSNQEYQNEKIVVSNADIFFDESLQLLETFDLTNTFLSLTRWNIKKDDSINLGSSRYDKEKNQLVPARPLGCLSSDTWIYQTPLVKFQHDDMYLGEPWSDACIVFQAIQAGLTVIDPCLTIKCYHLHKSRIRHWKWSPKPAKNYPFAGLQFSHLA